MSADTRKKIYDILKNKTGFMDSYEDFDNDMTTSEDARKKVYEVLRDKTGFNDTYENFVSGISGEVQRESAIPPAKEESGNVVTTVQSPSYPQRAETKERILNNIPDYFRSRGNDLSTLPLPQNTMSEEKPADIPGRIVQDEQQRIQLAERAANDPYMKQQELEHVFKPKNQEQIDSVRQLINSARQQRVKERQQRVKSAGGGGIFSTMSQAYLAGEQNDADKQLEYASTLIEQAQNITNEAKKKGNTNFFAGFARGFKDAPLDGWAMGLQDLKNYSAAKKVMDKVDRGEELSPSEDALMQALVTNAATQMYYSGDLGRGYKAGGVTAESLPFMLDMIAGMGTIQAVTKPASKAIVKYATEKAAKMGLGRATTGLAKGAARTAAGLGDVAAHTATFGGARVAADYQRRGLGDVQVSPEQDGTVSYAGRENVQTGAEAIGKSVVSTAAETGSELLGEYFAPMLGWVGKVTGANRLGKIIPASVGKAYSSIINSNGFKQVQEIARRAKIADPIGEYGEEVVNNLVSTAIGDMTPEQLVDLDNNIDTFLGVAPMSALFGAAGTGGYLREKYRNYRNMREFENQMRDTMGEDWSGVREALQDADIETARGMVKEVLSSNMQPDIKKKAINYISSVLQEQTLQEADKQIAPEEMIQNKRFIISNLNEARNNIGIGEEELNSAVSILNQEGESALSELYDAETVQKIVEYKNAYDDYLNYTYWVQNQAYDARKEAESQVERMTNATTGTVMRVKSGLSKNPVNILRGNIVFDAEGNVDKDSSDNTIYYLSEDGKVKMAPISTFESLIDDTPADELAYQAGEDAEQEFIQNEEAQIMQPEQSVQPIELGTTFQSDGVTYSVTQKSPDGYVVSALDEEGNPVQSNLLTEEQIRTAMTPAIQEEQTSQEQSVQSEDVTQPEPQQVQNELQTAISRIPVNENGEHDFESAPYQDTSSALIEISENVDDAKDTAAQMINHYQEELKKADKAKTTGNTIQEIVRLKQQKKANIQSINDKIAYWNSVANDIESKRPGGIIEQAKEESDANQHRLSEMTAEQQKAAQEEVQKKIDSGAYERKEPRKRARYVNEDNEMGTANTPMEHVLREIATGRVTFNWNDSGETQGLGSHLGLASSPEERRRMIWALSSDGMTPEAAAEQIHADMPENLQGMVTDQDVFNMILDAFHQNGTPSKMWESAKSMHGTDVEESAPGYEDYMEQQALEWEASQNNMTVEEWISYVDYVEEELDNMYSSVSDEDLKAIFEKFNEQIISENESRGNETEGAGSTEGQTDGEQGDELLPEGRGNNEGTDTTVNEQPEPANQTDGESSSVVSESEGELNPNIDLMSEQVSKRDLQIVRDAVGKTFQSKNGDYMTIENYKTNWDERKKLHGVTYNIDGEVQKKNVFIAELANALTSGNWEEVQNKNKTVKKGDIVSFNGSGKYEVLFTETKDGEKYATIENLENKKMPSISTKIDSLSPYEEEITKDSGFNVEKRYHKKENKDIYAVNFTKRMEREDFLAAKKKAKESGGYYSSFGKGGFIFYTEEEANNFAKSIVKSSENEEQKNNNAFDRIYSYIDNTLSGVENPIVDVIIEDVKKLTDDELNKAEEYANKYKGVGKVKQINLSQIKTIINAEKESRRFSENPEIAEEEAYQKMMDKYENYDLSGFDFDSQIRNRKRQISEYEIAGNVGMAAYSRGLLRAAQDMKEKVLSQKNQSETQQDIENARAEVEQNPTEAQKEAGNYKKGHVKVDGFDITIENPKGSVRSGKDADGKEWSVTMNNDYGYIRGTEGVDGDHIDVFLSDNPESGDVFVIDQVNPDGTFDEHKVMYGFKSALAAKRAYMANYSKDWTGLGNITRVSKEEFKKWVNSSRRKTKPFAEYKNVKGETQKEEDGIRPDEGVLDYAKRVAEREQKKEYGSQNKVVSTERYEELRKRLRSKLNNLNAGYDPELLQIGAEMAAYHVEAGARKFVDFAKRMISDMGDNVRPYLKLFYNAVRDFPGMESYESEMTPYEEVRSTDINNIKLEEDEQTETDKETVTGEAETFASQAESRIEEAGTEEEVDEVVEQIEDNIDEVNNQLSELDYLDSLNSGMRVVLKDGRNVLLSVVMHSGEQVSATQFSKPHVSSMYASYKGELINIMPEDVDLDATIRYNTPKSSEELSGDSSEYQDRSSQEIEAVKQIGTIIRERALSSVEGNEVTPLSMKDVKKILEGYSTLSDMSATDMQELVELAMTNETRNVALKYINSGKQKFGYDLILAMYNVQPLLNARDSTRFERQQYSTPTPFGYVMGQFVQSGKTIESVLEPSAGNGALTITFPSAIVHVNDIDERRLENLRTLGYGKVTNQDALVPFSGEVDAVLTNPPFGSTTAREFDEGQIKISSLEGLMAINALESMKDNGRAAIVIGGNTSYRDNGAMQSKDMRLFAYLYSHYNVVDVINLNGDMYKRNGTKYDVRIILINGRKKGQFKLIAPPVKSKARAEQVNSFEELYNRIQNDIRSLQQMGNLFDGTEGEPRTTDKKGSGTDNNVSDRTKPGGRRESVQADKGVRADNDMGSTENASVSKQRKPEGRKAENTSGILDNGNRSDAGSINTVQEQGRTDNGTDSGRISTNESVRTDSGDNTGRTRLSVNLTDEKVPYPNRSQSGTLMSVVPANQAQVLADSLANIGDVDQFLVDQLGYSSKDELFSYLAAEQIDSVSLAINQMNKGNGFIIGDMTGVGKGRQGAALIRYAVRKGYNPIYFTQKPALFSDNYRDLADIGSGELRPFIIASDPKNAAITDAAGNVVHKLPSEKERRRVFDYILKNGKLPEEYDYVITTYSQINNGTKEYEAKEDGIQQKDKSYKKKSPSAADKSGQERRDVIQALSKGNIMILDESHTAGGSGGGSMYMQYIMPEVKGVTFLSATFAKRADNMPIYAMKTDLSKSGISPQDMIEAISQGGVTLQEIMSKQLVQSGQMIRRERSFQGVTIDWMQVSEEEDAVQRKQFDEVSSIFSDIRAFQKDYITPIVQGISEELSEEGGYSNLQQGTSELGVTNTPFASKMYNLVNQLLFSLKADAVANRVIENLKNGFKPVISFTNTMEGFLDEAPKDTPMDKVPNFSATLMRALDGVMRYTETNLKGEKVNKSFTVNDLSEAGQNRYYEIKSKIEHLSADLPISPMDAIKIKIQNAGYKVGEITGRTLEMVQDENGKYIIQNRKDRDKKSAARDFNNGQLDVLMVNKSGSTGISLHASPKFEDQRQRVMVFAQFQSDINDEVQMRGRIDRTGQKFRGKYEYIMSSIPAEQRLQMMFKAKLKSLDANTTSSQKSKFNEMEVVDYLNKYGDEVTWQYMIEHPELSEKLGDPLNMLSESGEESNTDDASGAKKEGCAAKIARYLPFLPVKEQEEVFKEITDAYSVKIQLLNDAGENDLEITTMPLKAKTISKKIWKPGTEPNSGNAFADNTYLEEVEVDVLKKPMKAEEIRSTVKRMTSGENFDDWKEKKIKEMNSLYDEKIESLKKRLSQSAEERAEKAKKNYIAKSKEARENGKNEFTDEEIEKMSDVVVEDIMKKANESFIKQRNVIQERRDNILKQVNSFTPMKPLVIPFNLDEAMATIAPSRGMFLGFKFSKDYSPSSSTAVFATLDGRRKVEIPINQGKAFDSIRMNTMMQPTFLKDLNVDSWDSHVPTQTRKKSYVVTGNLLQALVDTKKSVNVKGYLVSYSTIEGDTKQGILLSDSFKPENLTTSAPISSRLIQIQQGETVVSEDKRVVVERNTGWRTGYALKVPRSKKQGGEFFEDNKLRSLADNKEFTTRGNYMVADISSDNLPEALDRLSKMGVTVSKKAKLENASDVRFREEDSPRSIVDPFIQELMMRFQGEDISRYPYVDVRKDPNADYEVYWGYSEPLYKGKNVENSEEVPELIKDIIRDNDSEIDKRDIIDNLNSYIEFNEGFEEAEEGQKVLDWFKENMNDFKMSDKVNVITERGELPDNLYREVSSVKSGIDYNENEAYSFAEKLNVPLQVVTSTEQISDPSVKSAIESGRKIKGWFSVSEGKVYVYLPNASGIEDVKQTILHEGVAHYGLRKLVGDERMDDFLDEVFRNVSKEIRNKIVGTLPKYGYDSRVATEEYLARMAESGVDLSTWERIKQAFKNLLRRIGINIQINDNELKYILWRSAQNLDKNRPIDLAIDVAMQYNMGVGNYLRKGSEMTNEENNIVIESQNNGTYMKAPNGKYTKLNERQWVQVRTKSFKDWFGDWENDADNASKVVDENGEPMVVYHGTNNEFNIFEVGHGTKGKGFFFTDSKEMAESYGENVKEVFLNIRDSYEIDGNGRNWNDIVINLSKSNNDLIKKIKLDRTTKYASVKKGNYPKENYEYFNNLYYKYIDAYDKIKSSNSFIDKIKKAYYLAKIKSFNTQKNISGTTREIELVLNKGENIIFKNIKDWGGKFVTENNTPNDVFVITDSHNVKSANENNGDFDPNNPDIRYRDSDGSQIAYENSLKGWKYKAREAYQDSMLALKNLQEVIANVSGKPIKSFEDAYKSENQLSSKNTSEAEEYYEKFFKPMLEAEGSMMKNYGLSHKEIERYMMLAHGIERNVEMTFRERLNEIINTNPNDAQQFADDFIMERDRLRNMYSGYEYLKALSDYIGEVGDFSATEAILTSIDNEEHTDFQNDALEYVKDFESKYDTSVLWDKTNRATKETIKKTYESGMMDKDHFAKVSKMFMYYVPLRGWNEKTAEDVYEYINSERSPLNSVLKSMKGRKSVPDEVMATIGNMAESAILQGNKNLMKQSFMNMVMNHPTDVATMRKAWYVYDQAKDEWTISMPEIQDNDTPEIISQKISDHEEKMKNLKEKGLATQKSSGLNIDYRILKNNISQHAVVVKNGGKDYIIYVNGNPRAAQAVNGLTNPDAEKNPIFNSISRANRWLAANFTTRNPAFVMSNLARDMIFSMSAIGIKEDAKYSSKFRKNLFVAIPTVFDCIRGKCKNSQSDMYFKEFVKNGGETGYMHLNDVDKYKKKVKKELSKITGERGSAKAALDYTLERLEDFNRWAEDVSRFAVYMTSRQMGRSIVDSVNDAKEVTVNFNKKGAGYKTGGFFGITAGIMRNLYLFFNASAQSLSNFNRLRVKNPVRFYSTLGGFIAAGVIMPVINDFLYNVLGGGDDNPYNDLPEWVRRNNLCIYAGNGQFVTIPLPIELRAFYGLGDYAYQLSIGREKPTPSGLAKGTVSQLADLLPLNPTGNEGFKTFMPDALSPIFETYVWNEDFTGKPIAKLTPFNERDPEWKRVYKGTSGWLVDASKFFNDLTNGGGPGSDFRKGFIDFNPAKVENLLESYFGGMAKFLNQSGKTIYYGAKSMAEGEMDENLVARNVPIVNRFYNKVDDRNAFSGINTEYFNLRDEMEQFKYELNGVKKNYRNNPEEYRQIVNSDMFRKYMKYKPYQDRLDRLYKMAKELEGQERKQVEDMIVEIRRELVNSLK